MHQEKELVQSDPTIRRGEEENCSLSFPLSMGQSRGRKGELRGSKLTLNPCVHIEGGNCRLTDLL